MTELGDSSSRNQSSLRRAFKKVRPLLDAMPNSALSHLNLDPLAAVAKVRGVLPAILLMRDSIEGQLKFFDLKPLDELETYALALIQAHAIYRGITARSQVLPKLSREACALRGQLLHDANTLVGHGLIQRARLSRLQGPNGYRNLASDLLTIGELLRDSWPTIANRTAISLARSEPCGDARGRDDQRPWAAQAGNGASRRCGIDTTACFYLVRWSLRRGAPGRGVSALARRRCCTDRAFALREAQPTPQETRPGWVPSHSTQSRRRIAVQAGICAKCAVSCVRRAHGRQEGRCRGAGFGSVPSVALVPLS